ncbi:TPA: hypothetical protein ACM266_002794 [Escherichia coli]
MVDVQIIPATEEHLQMILPDVRQADIDELYAVSLMTTEDALRVDAPRDKCTLSCAINGIHAAFHYLKKNYISGCVMTVPTG